METLSASKKELNIEIVGYGFMGAPIRMRSCRHRAFSTFPIARY